MICHFLLLKAPQKQYTILKFPGKCQKYNSVYNTGENELARSVGAVPNFYCPPTKCSPASATARGSCLTAEAEFRAKRDS